MPHHRRLFRFRVLLSLSLVYGCSTQPLQKPNPPSSSPSLPPTLSASPKPQGSPSAPAPSPIASPQAELRLLSAAEIDKLKASGLVEANNRFGWDLFNAIYKAEPNKNQFMSPLSAAIALQMTLQGADQQTLTQMKTALGLDAIENQTLLEHLPLLLAKLRRPAADITLEVANSIWASQNYRFMPEFMAAVKGPFEAEVANVDFLDPSVITRINQWSAKATHDKITEVVKPFPNPELIVAILVNAIYFNAKWSLPFDPHETIQKDFRREDGSTKPIQMMRQFSYLPYLAPSEAFPHQGIALPYGKEGKLRMYLFLPTEGKNLSDLQGDLAKQDFEVLSRRFYSEGGSLELPRFKLKWEQELNPHLIGLGMADAFSPADANFDKMTKSRFPGGNIYLSKVTQFSYVDVKEEGTEAAAVTVVEVSDAASSAPQRSHSMIVDHPFLFLIRDEETGQILFMGSITDPES